ncbi:unnamed protein product [Chondrus crispus]|uniref:Uncharacterized protein n=1 Tax=Chondrus crispus TaxID=2769 RepID=R7QDB5_CHOCR|nr:unnamed protein product [Chondrus crispus]CDF35778.1 unnamed protein product [Chondrus crispus]|eukprot:XP_005715597.1 unnamed protein product [Chondrus crispus]
MPRPFHLASSALQRSRLSSLGMQRSHMPLGPCRQRGRHSSSFLPSSSAASFSCGLLGGDGLAAGATSFTFPLTYTKSPWRAVETSKGVASLTSPCRLKSPSMAPSESMRPPRSESEPLGGSETRSVRPDGNLTRRIMVGGRKKEGVRTGARWRSGKHAAPGAGLNMEDVDRGNV